MVHQDQQSMAAAGITRRIESKRACSKLMKLTDQHTRLECLNV